MQPYGMIVALHAGSETEQTALCMEARTHDIRQRSLPNIGRSKKKKKKEKSSNWQKSSQKKQDARCLDMLVKTLPSNQAVVIVTWPEQVALKRGAQGKADISARRAYTNAETIPVPPSKTKTFQVWHCHSSISFHDSMLVS